VISVYGFYCVKIFELRKINYGEIEYYKTRNSVVRLIIVFLCFMKNITMYQRWTNPMRKSLGKQQLGRTKQRWEDSVKMEFQKIGFGN
jgi:hypothetical protein